SITALIGPRTLRFSAPGLGAATSDTIQLAVGLPAALAITTQPPLSSVSGQVFSRSPVVQLLDAGGNSVSRSGVLVSVAIAGGGATLDGTLSVATGSSGAASFTDLRIEGAPG